MRPILFACLALFALPLTARCQNGTGILMEPGLVLRADPPRQLTLNAHVPQFLYQPGGDSLAYVSVHDDGGARTVSVKFVGAHNKDPDTRTLYTVTGDSPDADPPVPTPQIPEVTLLGWSPDGSGLIFQQLSSSDKGYGILHAQFFRADLATFQTHPIPTPTKDDQDTTASAWSNGRLLIVEDRFVPTPDGTTGRTRVTWVEIYNVVRDKIQPFVIPSGVFVRGWLDEGHLLLQSTAYVLGEQPIFFRYDIQTQVSMQIAKPNPWPTVQGHQVLLATLPDAIAPKVSGLTLETQPHTLKDAQGVAQTKAQTVWLRKAKAPKALSALPIGVTPGTDDPQAQWSPDGDGVAFVAHGDLFVVALSEQEATPYEKVAASEKLDCAEEKQIIESNLKQIGLGILQYAQDNNEHFPSGEGWHDAVFPYIKDESVFNFAGVAVAYHPPADLSLAAMDDPAGTVIASADTPCAHIVLLGEGHVKAFNKAEGAGP